VGGSIIYNKILQQLLQEFPLQNCRAAAGENEILGGLVYETIKIYSEKL
jgi:hypothetical protein